MSTGKNNAKLTATAAECVYRLEVLAKNTRVTPDQYDRNWRLALGTLALPLLSYYALTLAVPLANGAAQSDTAFVRHAITVLAVPPVAIMLACAVHSTLRKLCRQD